MQGCPKCQGEMEHGELQGAAKWTPMPAHAPFLARLRYSLKLTAIDGMRCRRCGFLELYARTAR